MKEEEDADLVHKRLVQEVRPSNAEVEHINLLQNGVVEGIKKPRRVRHLIKQQSKHDNGPTQATPTSTPWGHTW